MSLDSYLSTRQDTIVPNKFKLIYRMGLIEGDVASLKGNGFCGSEAIYHAAAVIGAPNMEAYLLGRLTSNFISKFLNLQIILHRKY